MTAEAPKAGRGRPSEFSQEIADRICSLLEEGLTLRQACRLHHDLPHESTVRKWAMEDRNNFYTQYTKARELGYQAMADELVDITDDGSNDWMEREGKDGESFIVLNQEHVARSRLRIDTRKWLLSKALPKIYGDKMDLGDLTAIPVKLIKSDEAL